MASSDLAVRKDADALIAALGGGSSPGELEALANTIELEADSLQVGRAHGRAIAVELRRRALRMRNS